MIARLLCVVVAGSIVQAVPVKVKHLEGTAHAFLCIRDLAGKRLASGELIQVAQAGEVASHLSFHFRDGSVLQEDTIYSQRSEVRLVSDHLIEKGRSFPSPVDILVEASGQVTTRAIGSDKKEQIRRDRMDLPPDTSNGLLIQLLMNLQPDAAVTEVSMVSPTEKPRLLKLNIQALGEQTFSIGGARRKATDFVIRTKIGGLAGKIAPLIGKQPGDMHVWIMVGAAPVFIKEEGALYLGGPVLRIEQESPTLSQGAGS